LQLRIGGFLRRNPYLIGGKAHNFASKYQFYAVILRRMTAALDKIDRKLLAHLQQDASLTHTELSARVNLSPTAVMRRIERLKAQGFIKGMVALVDPAALDLTTLAIVGVVLDRSTAHAFADFEAAAVTIDGCLECHLVAGEFDYVLMVRTKDLARFNKLHAESILHLPGVRQIRTFFVLKEILSTTVLPV
jgi:DNA-binding Lrp family transcriptional regulator